MEAHPGPPFLLQIAVLSVPAFTESSSKDSLCSAMCLGPRVCCVHIIIRSGPWPQKSPPRLGNKTHPDETNDTRQYKMVLNCTVNITFYVKTTVFFKKQWPPQAALRAIWGTAVIRGRNVQTLLATSAQATLWMTVSLQHSGGSS
ncbi:hypothetical protein mRhiFer1_008705 [Rhinolophus ferrumequinum]|uniref:Uncharacterized protein n=1 Tax=Rhinolophus ferrumequinum TaxID=59479 RepID=A0A7J7TQF2_RHIFE|nr:hypothetical protein mRhiFer1_008705 [Rhinolophus ferrumequinum]